MNIVTRGMGFDQQLVTQGYGFSITIHVDDSDNEYRHGGIGKAKKFDFEYLKDLLKDIIETEKILLKKDKISLTVEINFVLPEPIVSAELQSISYKNHTIKLKVTN